MLWSMIRTFRGKALARFWDDGDPAGIRPDLVERVRHRLTALAQAKSPADLSIPGFRLHRLHGKPVRWAIAVNGPWRITFSWIDTDVIGVDLEQYH